MGQLLAALKRIGDRNAGASAAEADPGLDAVSADEAPPTIPLPWPAPADWQAETGDWPGAAPDATWPQAAFHAEQPENPAPLAWARHEPAGEVDETPGESSASFLPGIAAAAAEAAAPAEAEEAVEPEDELFWVVEAEEAAEPEDELFRVVQAEEAAEHGEAESFDAPDSLSDQWVASEEPGTDLWPPQLILHGNSLLSGATGVSPVLSDEHGQCIHGTGRNFVEVVQAAEPVAGFPPAETAVAVEAPAVEAPAAEAPAAEAPPGNGDATDGAPSLVEATTESSPEVLEPNAAPQQAAEAPFVNAADRPYRQACENILARLPESVHSALALAWADDDLDHSPLVERLARVMAQRLDDPVLLVELRGERGSVGVDRSTTTQAHGSPESQVPEALAGRVSWRELIVQTDTAGLCVLPASPGDFEADPLTVGQLIDGCRREFALVLFSGGPAQSLPESLLAACDGAILVVEARHTPAAVAAAARERMTAAGAELLGCLLTGASAAGEPTA